MFNEPMNEQGNPLRFFNESNELVTCGMFLEFDSPDSWVQFTLATYDQNHNGLLVPSIHRLYVEHNDLSEYDFAVTHFYSFAHWELVKSQSWFIDQYRLMRKELEAKLQSKSMRCMVNQITSGTATQATLKYFSDREFELPVQPETKADMKIDKDYVKQEAAKVHEAAMVKGNLSASTSALKIIGQHSDVDAFAADKVEITAPIQVVIDGDLSKV